MNIPFNKPYLSGKELEYIQQAVASGKISGDGQFTLKCQSFFENRFHFRKCLLTTSCTDALEMAAILIDTQAGDEIIIPSYTFVSTVNAFVLRGANIVFADSQATHPNLDVEKVAALITPRTKAIVAVHYAGMACDMEALLTLCQQHNLFLIEDAAQAIDNYYDERPLGSFGHLAAFSFHETKNIISGEGGMLVINDEQFLVRAEIIREKGTNRSQFFRGEVDKYGWVDIGSSFLPSDLIAAFLFAQCEQMDRIQNRRKLIWHQYLTGLQALASAGKFALPEIPQRSGNNAHMMYLVCNSLNERQGLIGHLKTNGIHAVFHYQSLHQSTYFQSKFHGEQLLHADRFTDTLLRLPLYYELEDEQVAYIIDCLKAYYS